MPPQPLVNAAGEINFPYTVMDLSRAVNILPNVYGRIRSLGIFGEGRGIVSTFAMVRYREGEIRVLPAKGRGATPTPTRKDGEKTVILEIPHYPWSADLRPEDLQNLAAYEGAVLNEPRSREEELNKILERERIRGDVNLEYQRSTGLHGLIVDGAGEPLLDLYETFGFNKKIVNFHLSNPATNVIEKIDQISDHITDNLKGETLSAIRVMVAPDFMRKMIFHPSLKDWMQTGPQLAVEIIRQAQLKAERNEYVKEIEINDVIFETYRGSVTLQNGATHRLIEAGGGIAIPMGTMNAFDTVFAPPHDIRAVNEPGVQIWVSPLHLDHGAGIELQFQQNALSFMKRPDLIVQVRE